ncbi:pyridoxamine 5'-phosphate oxidase family protein [Virgibacillus necropolis]|uniref:Pyridoxamine 5-phosphate oxidase n=1 Tax=Virgibacillus necropolis TaxID=163877 RepID=A0A221MFU7_9BACI|nr:pyridoxamine 5'-phosphate oxidase family protein [Virgibacillus necropolis]ASN06492.1 pyridoxamine 5-phosphate oxidase [Virgibacillus necropolis]
MSKQHGEHILQEKYNTRKRAASFYDNQLLNYLNPLMQEFVSEQEMVFISTADAGGNCDSSFRAGPEGFVRIVDDKTLLYPEYKGNGVMASLGNILENPHIGLMFIDFFENSIGLHINGVASILDNEELTTMIMTDKIRDDIEKETKAERWVVIKVDEAYIHCSKHIPKLCKPENDSSREKDDKAQKSGDFFKVKQSKK